MSVSRRQFSRKQGQTVCNNSAVLRAAVVARRCRTASPGTIWHEPPDKLPTAAMTLFNVRKVYLVNCSMWRHEIALNGASHVD